MTLQNRTIKILLTQSRIFCVSPYLGGKKGELDFFKGNIKEFSFQSMVDEYKSYEDKYVPSFSVQVDLNIPKLDLPKLQKIDG